MIHVTCDNCKAQMQLKADWAGKKGKCPNCGRVLVIPPRPAALPASSPPPLPPVAAGEPPLAPPKIRRLGTPPLPWVLGGIAAVFFLIVVAVLFRGSGGDSAEAPVEPAVAEGGGQAPPPSAVDDSGEPPAATAGGSNLPVEPPPRPAGRKPPAAAAGASREISSAPTAAAEPPAAGSGPGLVGMSRQYDDLHCQQIQIGHGVRIPAGALILEVDGMRLPVENPGALADGKAPILFLPRGSHLVRFRIGERPVEVTIASDFLDDYQAMRRYFAIDGGVRMDELFRRGGRAMDVHNAPFLLNFAAAGHVAENRLAAAERHFRRALSVNPAFSPAHLNLAECLLRRNAKEEAARELLAADAFNVGNVFGLAEAVFRMRSKLGLPRETSPPIDAASLVYAGSEQVSEEDGRLVALMEGISKYAVAAEEKAKILNNLAVHFDDTKRPELALHYFREALAAVKYSGTGRFAVARQILANMSRACRSAGFEEAEDYEQMQFLVTP